MRLIRYSYPNSRYAAPALARTLWSGLEGEIDRLFSGALRSQNDLSVASRIPVDLYKDKDNTYVRAELPGFKREDIHVELADGYLTLQAARKASAEGRDDAVTFSRVVTVPDEAVVADQIAATYEDGVLTVTLPHREETKPRKITVTVK